MANKESEIKRRVEFAKQQFAEYSRTLQLEQRSRQMFPSCEPGGRGAVSPLGNVSPDWEWSGRKEKS
jgi:hypothetical protein